MVDQYGLSPTKQDRRIEAPVVDFLPKMPAKNRTAIAVIGAGSVSEFHLKSYREFGFNVFAIADRNIEKARDRRDEFFPQAIVFDDYRELLEQKEIEVVDVTTHPTDRVTIMQDAIGQGKHVLSQKPFVMDLEIGDALVRLADQHQVKLAVNQNGRWAPHFNYLRRAVASGLIGEVTSIDFSLQWDQTWIAGIESFDKIHHLVLFDFGIHWFDMACCLLGDQRAQSVYASATRFDSQRFTPPAIASAIINYPSAQVRMSFNAHTQLGEEDVTTVVGTQGTLRCRGPGLNDQPEVQVSLPEGNCTIPLTGCWFEEGFGGAMAELLCAIEENRTPYHNAQNNLSSLSLCFAAVKSADTNQVVTIDAK